MSERAACAHRNVSYIAVVHENGTESDSWECDLCHHKFWPVAAPVPASTEREAQGPREPVFVLDEVMKILGVKFGPGLARYYPLIDRVRELARASREQPAVTATSPQIERGEISDGYHTFNELYEHRHTLFAIICNTFGGWKSKLHDDGTMYEGWFIAGVETPRGQATYHLPLSYWNGLTCRELERAPRWDGHTPADVLERLPTLTRNTPQIELPSELRELSEEAFAGEWTVEELTEACKLALIGEMKQARPKDIRFIVAAVNFVRSLAAGKGR